MNAHVIPQTDALEFLRWNIVEADLQSLMTAAEKSPPISVSWGTISPGVWVRRKADPLDCRPFQVVSTNSENQTVRVLINGVENTIDEIKIEDLIYSEPPNSNKFRVLLQPSREDGFIVYQKPISLTKKPDISPQIKLESLQLEAQKTLERLERSNECLNSVKTRLSNFLNSDAPDQTKISVSEFLELKEKFSRERVRLENAVQEQIELNDRAAYENNVANERVERLKAEIERKAAIEQAEKEFQKAFSAYSKALAKLSSLNAFGRATFELNELKIPSFSNGKLELMRVSQLLRAL